MNKEEIQYRLFKELSNKPDLTQREMANRVNLSLGKLNYCLSELVKKGFIKVKRFRSSHNKAAYMYILTPRGLEEKARVTLCFLRRKMAEYEELRQEIQELTREVEEENLGALEEYGDQWLAR